VLVLMEITPQTGYQADVILTANQIFLNPDPSNNDLPVEIGGQVPVYNIPDLRQYFMNAVDQYYELDNEDNSNLGVMVPLYQPDVEDPDPLPPILYVFTKDAEVEKQFVLGPGNYGPFNSTFSDSDVKKFLSTVDSMTVFFILQEFLNPYASAIQSCYQQDF